MNTFGKSILYWLPLAVLITAFSGLTYVTGQQSLRIGANDPQIQIAEDTANEISQGKDPVSFLMTMQKVDLSQSLAPFVIILNSAKQPIFSSAVLHDQTPSLPIGVFDSVQQGGEDRFTWQPETSIRLAAVVTQSTGAKQDYVVAGRSLREVEIRENNLFTMTSLVWSITMLSTFAIVWFITVTFPKKKKK